MSVQLRDCPPQWYDCCANALAKCRVCAAGFGDPTAKLYYEPQAQACETDHPYKAQLATLKKEATYSKRQAVQLKNLARSRETKKGFEHEKTISRRLVKQTLGSGRINGDGDFQVLPEAAIKIQTDVKYRHRGKGFSVSWAEYQKGKLEGTNCWEVTTKDDTGQEHSLVCLTPEVYAYLVGCALEIIDKQA